MIMSRAHIHQCFVKCRLVVGVVKGCLCKILDAFIDVFFLLCLLWHRDFDSLSDLTEESKVKYIAQRWEELGLKHVQVTNHTALLSYPGPALSTIVDKIGNQCYLPSGVRCGQPSTSTTEPFAFAAYSAVGSLVVSYSKYLLDTTLTIVLEI